MQTDKLRLLIVTHFNVYPVDSGSAMTAFSYIDEIRKTHEVSVLITDPFIPKEPHLSEIKKRWGNVKLYCLENPPARFNFLKSFIRKVVNMLRPQPKTEIDGAYYEFTPVSKDLVKLVQQIIEKDNIQVVEVNYTEKFSLVSALPDTVLKVAVEHEPKFRRLQTFLKNGLIEQNWGTFLHHHFETMEMALLQQYDATICLNDHDRELVAEKISKPVYVSPVSASWEDIATINTETSPIETVFFLGGGDHYPNYDALVWYKETIGQVAFEKFGVKLEVIGSWSAPKREPLKCDYIVFRGFVDDLNEVADNSLMLVPVRLGGGIRTKIQWAMSKGVPVVSTFFGYEGIPAIDGESVLEGNTPEIFIENIGKVLSDNMLRNQLRQNANQLIRQYFSPATVVASREQIYQELLRTKNS